MLAQLWVVLEPAVLGFEAKGSTASITASATLPFCSFIAAGFHPLCSIDIGDTPY